MFRLVLLNYHKLTSNNNVPHFFIPREKNYDTSTTTLVLCGFSYFEFDTYIMLKSQDVTITYHLLKLFVAEDKLLVQSNKTKKKNETWSDHAKHKMQLEKVIHTN